MAIHTTCILSLTSEFPNAATFTTCSKEIEYSSKLAPVIKEESLTVFRGILAIGKFKIIFTIFDLLGCVSTYTCPFTNTIPLYMQRTTAVWLSNKGNLLTGLLQLCEIVLPAKLVQLSLAIREVRHLSTFVATWAWTQYIFMPSFFFPFGGLLRLKIKLPHYFGFCYFKRWTMPLLLCSCDFVSERCFGKRTKCRNFALF